mmetsp:Transcript_27727/g.86264  ORF Transcript_27727/g.86264 Transcript_27727/m.86264 type:complete len:223 (-) Transcript_27727:3-671(-)
MLILGDHAIYNRLTQRLCGLLGDLLSCVGQAVALLPYGSHCRLLDEGLPLSDDGLGARPVVALVAATEAAATVHVGVLAAAPELRGGDAPPGRLPIGATVVVVLPLQPLRADWGRRTVRGAPGEDAHGRGAQQHQGHGAGHREAPNQPPLTDRVGRRGSVPGGREQGRALLRGRVAILPDAKQARGAGHWTTRVPERGVLHPARDEVRRGALGPSASSLTVA